MNLNHLRVFHAVSEASSITGGAQRLSISQPAVSKQLAEFEQALGTTLVDRLPRGIRLTAAGRLLEEHARRIFTAERAAEDDIAELLGLARGGLTVGASTTIGSYLIPQLFGEYRREHPGIELNLEIANTAAIQSEVLAGSVDVGLTEGLVSSDQLAVEIVAHDDMVMIAPPGHESSIAASIRAKDLVRLPLICRERGSGTRDVIEAALAKRGIAVDPILSFGSTEAVKNAVTAGLGLAIVSRLTVELELETERLVAIDIPDLRIHRALHMLTLKAKRASPAASSFVGLLRRRLGT